jgi:hypothetical protein
MHGLNLSLLHPTEGIDVLSLGVGLDADEVQLGLKLFNHLLFKLEQVDLLGLHLGLGRGFDWLLNGVCHSGSLWRRRSHGHFRDLDLLHSLPRGLGHWLLWLYRGLLDGLHLWRGEVAVDDAGQGLDKLQVLRLMVTNFDLLLLIGEGRRGRDNWHAEVELG